MTASNRYVCCYSYGDQSWANRLRHGRFYELVYGIGLTSFIETCGSTIFAILLTICVIVIPIESFIRLLALGRQFFLSAMDIGDLMLGIIMTIIALATAWGECSTTKHRIAALMAVLCLARNGVQLIRLLMAIRKDRRNRSAREATIEFTDERGYSMESERHDGGFVLGDSDDEDVAEKTRKQGRVDTLPV
ncbi:hypothetical protein BDF19DRAFT_446922 [Syncephalis fuscata]|nr:hypothetical protein BDF19DRAFT_446922 [Syncephalis fuscata]